MLNAFSANGLRSKVAATDWNGDGHMDVVVGGNTSILAVALGPLAGKKELTVELVWPRAQLPFDRMTTNPCIADWDGDGLDDLIVGGERDEDTGRQVCLFRNEGTSTNPKLAAPKPLLTDKRVYTRGISVADWNGDGRLDLIASRGDKNKQVQVYLRSAEPDARK